MARAAILFPLPLPEAFDYAVPDGMTLAPGDHVVAPLGPHPRRGVVWRVSEGEGGNLKPVTRRLDAAPLPEASRAFIDWAARYLVTPPGQILQLVARVPEALAASPVELLLRPGDAPSGKTSPARLRALETLSAAGAPISKAELARASGVSAGVIAGLVAAGAIHVFERLMDPPFPPPDPDRPAPPLSQAQADAADALSAALGASGSGVALLDGVTGSGKTEVYLELAARALRADPLAQVLILLPEIALTQAVVARIAARFGAEPVQWHSEAPPPYRRRAMREIMAGRARLVVGARSALFLPYPALRLIVVDEEHDGSFKQDEGLRYQARDLAVARGRIGGAGVVLASATPSLETMANVEGGRYARVALPGRFGAAVLPRIDLIDMRADPPERGRWLSPVLERAMAETLARGEQSLLFLNRRGFAPLVLCRACGHRLKAPDTDSWLVEHRYSGRLVCHVSGFSMPKPLHCPACGAADSLVSVGPGVERVLEEARGLFPEARVALFSSDSATTPAEVRALVEAMAAGSIDILVGTQIVAKGHNFPNLTLVGVVDGDLGLKGGDLRAGERTYQLLSQVAGRAGRADRPGRALIQTYAPEHEALQALARGDRDGFLAAEQETRRALAMPPYGRLAALHLAAEDDRQVEAAAAAALAAAPAADGVEVYGPAAPPLGVVRGWRRRRFLVKADRGVDLSAFMRAWRARLKLPASVRLVVDIDPYNFL